MNFNKTLSYSNYERLRRSNIESLSEEELSKFLILDYFSAFPSKTRGVKDVREEYFNGQEILIQKYNKYKPLFFFLDRFFLKLTSSSINSSLNFSGQVRKKILFQNSKYPSLILEAKKYYSVGLITQGTRDRFFAFKNFIGYVGVNDLDQLVYDYLKEGDIKYLYQLINKIEERLKIVNPNYVVLWDDGLPIGRAIALVSRKLGITTLVIQQGLYDPYFPLFNDLAADYVLVWGKYFRNLFLEQNARKPEDIYVLGYPLDYIDSIKKNETTKKSKNYTLCYLAQDWERYNKDFLAIKLENAKKIYEICKKLGLKFIYRPHPWEDREVIARNLSSIEFTPKKEKLEETIKKADIFISFSSTSLIEASMGSKISLQIMNYSIKSNNFEKLGACSKSFETISELDNYLAEVTSAPNLDRFKPKFNNDYIETRYNPAKRFLEIIREIEK